MSAITSIPCFRSRSPGPTPDNCKSCGAFNSPQLLQLSGVGPGDLLRKHGIEVIADMRGVGADLQDHYQTRFNYRGNTRNTINDMMGSVVGRVSAGLRYALFRKGFLTIGAGY